MSGKTAGTRDVSQLKQTVFSGHNSVVAQVNSAVVMTDIRMAQAQANPKPSMGRGGKHEVSALAKELLATDNCWEKKSL